MSRTLKMCLAVVLLVAAGCASSGRSPAQVDTSKDLAEMKERILELQERAAMAEVELDRLRAQVSELEQRSAGAEMARPVAAAETPAAMPTPDEPPPPIGNTAVVAVEESDLEIEPLTDSPAASSSGEVSAPTGSGGAPTEQSQSLQPVEPAAQALYDRGYTLYHQGKYLDAEASFQRFLQAYPTTELSDNAQFWIGESRYARGDIRGALAAFREVLQKYPEGNKIPDALIKEGDCLAKLGDRDGARDRYDEVKRRFPDSGAAVVADDRLSALDG